MITNPDVLIETEGQDSDLLRQIIEIQVQAEEQERLDRENMYSKLARVIEAKLTERITRKGVKQAQMLESLRLVLGSLASYDIVDSDDPFRTEKRHRPSEVNITRSKCEIAVSQMSSFQFAAGDKNWQLEPPQVIDVDDDDIATISQMQGVQLSPEQVVDVKMGLMEREMEHQLVLTDYARESRKGMCNEAVFGTAVVKGPMNIGRLRKVYRKEVTSEGKTIRVPKFETEYLPHIYCVNPLLWFPDDSVYQVEDCEDSIEVHPKSKTQLKAMMQHKGFLSDQIEMACKEKPRSYSTNPLTDQGSVTAGNQDLFKDKYLVLEYHGPICREDLELMGHSPSYETPDDMYYAEVWVVNGRVIRVELSNLEGMHRIPYFVSVWEKDPGSIFGFGIPMLIRDQQRIINQTHRMILDNAGISAGPQVIVDTTLIRPAEGGLECTPWKVWYVNEFGADTSKAMTFYMPPNAFEGLSALFTMTKSLADEESSISLLSAGLGLPTGAADNATSMAIMNQNATSPLFFKAEEWDDNITKPLLESVYDWNMQYNPKDEIKGSFTVDVRTPTQLLRGTQEQQKLERLSMEIAQGSPAAEWIKMDGLVTARLRLMRLPVAGIIKTPEEVAEERANAPEPQPDPAMIEAQAKMAAIEVQNRRIALDEKKLEMEMHQKNEELKMELAVQMETNRVRELEAMSSVQKAQFDFQAAMATLASRSDADRAKILSTLDVEGMRQQTAKFLAGTNVGLKVRQQDMDAEELAFKRKTGKPGI